MNTVCGRPGLALTNKGFSSIQSENKTYTLKKTPLDSFTSLDMTTSYADVTIQPSTDDKFYLEYRLNGNTSKPVYEVSNDILLFHEKEDSEFTINLGSSFTNTTGPYYVKLYVPNKHTFDAFQLYNNSGDVTISDFGITSGEIALDYGSLTMSQITGKTLHAALDSGDMDADSLTFDSMDITTEYGNVILKDNSCNSIEAAIDSGDLEIDAKSLVYLNAKNSYGDCTVRLPKDMDAKRYSYNLITDYGDINLPTTAVQGIFKDDGSEQSYQHDAETKNSIKIYADSGDIKIQ